MNIAENTESSSIIVQWDEVDDSLPTTYIVTWSNERDHIEHPATIEEQSSYTITGLTLDTVYTITVTATNICGTGPEYSTSVSLTTDVTSSSTSTITAVTNTMVITPAASLSTSTAITKSSAIAITTTNPITTSIVLLILRQILMQSSPVLILPLTLCLLYPLHIQMIKVQLMRIVSNHKHL